jgi:hypothetical protein
LIYLCGPQSGRIIRIDQNGTPGSLSVVYQATTGGPQSPEGPSFNTTGNLAFNTRSTTGGVWEISFGSTDVPGAPVQVIPPANGPTDGEGTRFDGTDRLLIVDRGGSKVLQQTAPGASTTTTLINNTNLSSPISVAVDSAGDIFVSSIGTNTINRFNSSGVFQNTYVTFTGTNNNPFYMQFDASDKLYAVTAISTDGSAAKVWRVDPVGTPPNTGTATLLIDVGSTYASCVATPTSCPVPGLASGDATGLALPATSFTTAQQAVAPGTTTTYTNGMIASEMVLLPPDVVMNGTAFMAEKFIQVAPSVFNATIPAGGSTPPSWLPGAVGVPAGSKCTPFAGAGGNCMILEKLCSNSSGVAITPCNIAVPTGSPSLIELTIHYKTQSSLTNPAVVEFSDGGTDYGNITNFFNPADPTSGGGTKFLNTSTSILNQPGFLPADTTPPTVTASTSPLPNGAGWNNTSPVSVLISASDDQSINNIMYSTTGAQTIANTTVVAASTLFPIANQGSTTVNFSATDNASPTPFTTNGTLTVKIDTTPPSISITSPTNGATYTITQAVAASYACADPIPSGVNLVSGVATCAGPVASGANIDTASVGSKTFTVNSTDVAGNSATKAVSYSVSYNICVLYDQTRSVKGGAVFPIKIQLCDASGNNLSSSAVVVTATGITLISTSVGTPEAVGSANPENNFRFDSTLGTTGTMGGYIYNLSTNGLATGTYGLQFTAGSDPTTHTVTFGVK